jgi:hypothetical protein
LWLALRRLAVWAFYGHLTLTIRPRELLRHADIEPSQVLAAADRNDFSHLPLSAYRTDLALALHHSPKGPV